MKFKYTYLIAAFLSLFLVLPLQAQDSFSPDRPGIGNGSYTVNPGSVYLEGGVEFFNTEFSETYSFGQVLVRTGLSENLELRGALNSFVVLDGFTTQTGIQDFGLGLKAEVYESEAEDLRISALGEVSLPTGSDAFGSDEAQPTLGLIADIGLNPDWGLSTNLAHSFLFDDLEGTTLFTLTPSYAIPSSEDKAMYFGYAGFYPSAGSVQHFAELGFTMLPAEAFQLDLNTGIELDSGNFFIGAGLAGRF